MRSTAGAAGDEAGARRQHAWYFLQLPEKIGDAAAWRHRSERLAIEFDNLRALRH
jgi:hypothetical protein